MLDVKVDRDACDSLSSRFMDEEAAIEMAHLLSALADPVRLRIYSAIASSVDVCSCHLEGPLAKSQPTISHHTRILSEAGLIVGEKRGRWTYWRVVPERLAVISRLLQPGELSLA